MAEIKKELVYQNYQKLLEWIFVFFDIKSNDKYNNFSTFADYVNTSRSNVTYWKNGRSFPDEQKQANLIKGISRYLDFRSKTENQFIEALLQFCEAELNINRKELYTPGRETLAILLNRVFQKVYSLDMKQQQAVAICPNKTDGVMEQLAVVEAPPAPDKVPQTIKKRPLISFANIIILGGVLVAIFLIYEWSAPHLFTADIYSHIGKSIVWPKNQRTGNIIVTKGYYELDGSAKEAQMWGNGSRNNMELFVVVEFETPDQLQSVGVGLETWNTSTGKECSVCFRNSQLQVIYNGLPILTKNIDSFVNKKIWIHFQKSRGVFCAAIEKGLDEVVTIKTDVPGSEEISVQPRIYTNSGKIKLYAGYFK
jgi:hypothetical protein